MKTYIALFRGINVGGKNTLPMRELVAVLEDLGARNVKTYIQSGNAVFVSLVVDPKNWTVIFKPDTVQKGDSTDAKTS